MPRLIATLGINASNFQKGFQDSTAIAKRETRHILNELQKVEASLTSELAGIEKGTTAWRQRADALLKVRSGILGITQAQAKLDGKVSTNLSPARVMAAQERYKSESKRLLDQQEKEKLEADVRAATRSNSARRLLRQRAAQQEAREASKISEIAQDLEKQVAETRRAEEEKTKASIDAAARANRARQLLRQREAVRVQAEAVSAQQRLDAAVEQASRDNLARRLRREREMKRQERAREQAEATRAASLRGQAGEFLSSSFARTAAPLAIAYGVVNFAKEAVAADVAYQRMENTLKAASGSAGQAADDFAYLRREADRIGFSILDVGQQFARFSISARNAGLTTNETRRFFSALMESSSKMGLSFEQQGRALTAFEQMLSKGKVSMEELRQQLGDAMPGAVNMFAKALGVSTDKLLEMVKAGEVSAVPTLRAVTAEMENVKGQASKTVVDIARLQNAWQDFKADAGEGLRPFVSVGSQQIISELKSLQMFGAGIGASIGGIFSGDYYAGADVIAKKFFNNKATSAVGSKWRDTPETPDMRWTEADQELADKRQKEAEGVRKIEEQITDEQERRAEIGMSDAQKRLKLIQDIAKAEHDAKQAYYAGDSEEEVAKKRLEAEKLKTQLANLNGNTKALQQGGQQVSLNANQRIGAFASAITINPLIDQARQQTQLQAQMVAKLDKIQTQQVADNNNRGVRYG